MARSITSTDANGATFETVGSTTGFSAGDLVYYGSTGYGKITAAAPSTTTSSVVKAYPTLPVTGGSTAYFEPTNFTGLGFSRSVALLSNGNAVAVYANPVDGYPYFVVYTPSTRAIVTGPTVISTTFSMTATNQTNGYNIGVSAFSGGNFLVYWGNNAGGTANRVNYATYTNAGVAVVAVTQDFSLAVNNVATGHMRGVTLANGGFVLAFGNGNNVYFRAYDAAGVGQFSWLTLTGFSSGATASASPSWGMTARSDNTYLLTGKSTTAGTYNYAIFNYAGGTVVSTTTFTVVGGTTNGATDCTTLSDGTTFVIAYVGDVATSVVGWAFRFLPTGNVLGSANVIQGNFNSSTGNANANYLRVWALDSGRFMMTGLTDTTAIGCYAVFNSSGTPLLGTFGTTGTASLTRNFGGYYQGLSVPLGVIVTGGNAEVYLTPSNSSQNSSNTVFVRVSLTTYNLVSSNTVSGAITVSSSVAPASTYVATNSTPSKASYALTNGVFPYAPKSGNTVTATGVYPTPTRVLNSVASFDMCTLSNGNLCVVTNSTSTGATTVYIYNPVTLALISSRDLSSVAGSANVTTATGIIAPNVRVTPLSGGSFCVGVGTSSTNLCLTAWTSAFVQQGSTVNITTFSQTFGATARNFSLCTISSDRVVVVYMPITTSLSYAIYSNVLSVVVAPTVVASDTTGVTFNGVAPIPKGFTVATNRTTAGGVWFYNHYEFSTNTFSQPSYAISASAALNGNNYTFLASSGNGPSYIGSVDTGAMSVRSITNGSSATMASVAGTNIGTGSGGFGVTASGNVVVIVQDNLQFVTNVGIITSSGMSPVASLAGWIAPTTRIDGQQLRIMPLYGNIVLVGYLVDTSNGLAFGTLQVNGFPDSQVFSTADTSDGVPIYPLATTATTPAIANTTFAGVAVTDCAAGSTGVIQTTGTTNLNSTYPTTTAQTFDYTGQAAPGIKGTISGRSISMRKS